MICSGQNVLRSDSEAAIEKHHCDRTSSLILRHEEVLKCRSRVYSYNAEGAHGHSLTTAYVKRTWSAS